MRLPVAFMMAAIVVPVGDCSIAMTRACFERASVLLAFGASADCWEGFAALTDPVLSAGRYDPIQRPLIAEYAKAAKRFLKFNRPFTETTPPQSYG